MVRIDLIVNVLTYLIAIIAVLPLSSHMPVGYIAGFFVCVFMSIYADTKKVKIISRNILNIVSVLIVVYTVMQMSSNNIVIPSIKALISITAVKFVESDKEYRDYMQIYTLSIFMLAGFALLDLGIGFLAYIIIELTLISSSTVFLTYFTEEREFKLKKEYISKLFLRTLLIPVFAVPLAALIFIVLPRLDFPIFNFLNIKAGANVGFSSKIKIGDVADIQDSADVVFRAVMSRIDDRKLYWRGVVLDKYNKGVWVATPHKGKPALVQRGEIIEQTIYLEPYYDRYLFALDKAINIDYKSVSKNNEFVYRVNRPIHRRIEYDVFSAAGEYLNSHIDDRNFYTDLPDNLSRDFYDLVERLKISDNVERQIKFIEIYFAKEGYKHSLKNLPTGDNAIEDFLFNKKIGNCEFYATTGVFLLRAMGIPSRIVAGYKGGYYNEDSGYYVIYQKNAHTWIEAFVEGKGWIRIDPTPAGSDFFVGSSEKGMLFKLRLFADNLTYQWNKLVISFNFDSQVKIFEDVSKRFKRPNIKLSDILKIKNLGVVLLIFIILTAYRLRKIKFLSKEEQIIKNFEKILAEKGFIRKENEGLFDFAAGITCDDLKSKAIEFVDVFQSSFYGGKAADYDYLKSLLREINKIKVSEIDGKKPPISV